MLIISNFRIFVFIRYSYWWSHHILRIYVFFMLLHVACIIYCHSNKMHASVTHDSKNSPLNQINQTIIHLSFLLSIYLYLNMLLLMSRNSLIYLATLPQAIIHESKISYFLFCLYSQYSLLLNILLLAIILQICSCCMNSSRLMDPPVILLYTHILIYITLLTVVYVYT